MCRCVIIDSLLSCWSNSISNYFPESQWAWIKDTICSDHSDPKPIFCGSTPTPPTPTPPTPTPPAPTSPRDCTNPNKYRFVIEISTDEYASQDTSFKVKQRNNKNKFGKNKFSIVSLPDNKTVTYSKCLPRKKCYKFFMYDSYGDGLCCSYGSGSYTAYWNGKWRLTLWFALSTSHSVVRFVFLYC